MCWIAFLLSWSDEKDGKVIAYGTGFFGLMQLNEKSSFVLVTNYHVIGSEEIAARCVLHFEGMDVQLSLEELLVKTTFMNSDINKVSDACAIPEWFK